MEQFVIFEMGSQQKNLKKPCGMCQVPFWGTYIRYRLNYKIFNLQWIAQLKRLRSYGVKPGKKILIGLFRNQLRLGGGHSKGIAILQLFEEPITQVKVFRQK